MDGSCEKIVFDEEVAKMIVEYGEMSQSMEEKRNRDLITQSNFIILTISLLMIFTFNVVAFFLSQNEKYYINVFVSISSFVLFLMLLVSLFFCVYSQYGFEREYLNNIEDFYEHVMKNGGINFQDYFEQRKSDISLITKGIDKINTKQKKLLNISIILLGLFIPIFILFTLIIFFVLALT